MNNRRLAKSACALGLALCLAAPAAAASYSDVPAGSWYAAAVQEVSDKGLMTGVTDTVFSPTGTVTRSTVITVLWRLEGSPAATIGERFTDVPEGAWYAAAADWAKGKGIASGNGKGAFEPDAAITREQLAVFLYNYAKYKGDAVAEGVLEQYADESAIHAWAMDGMRHAVGAGLLRGGSDNRLNPTGTATRAELAVILDRMMTPVMG